ncbi:MAG: GNAT family N-acetyltransferase [Colwellia sp.]|nr:GNAT family N-acetyltransferase [Colwellia sp.]
MDIIECNKNDVKVIGTGLSKYNAEQVPYTQNEPFVDLNYKIEEDGEVVAGVLGCLYCWGCLYISTLFVSEKQREKGYGKDLLIKIESEAKKLSCHIVHLDTFDFQAKDFYIQEGYEVFGELLNCPKNHTRIFLKKEI